MPPPSAVTSPFPFGGGVNLLNHKAIVTATILLASTASPLTYAATYGDGGTELVYTLGQESFSELINESFAEDNLYQGSSIRINAPIDSKNIGNGHIDIIQLIYPWSITGEEKEVANSSVFKTTSGDFTYDISVTDDETLDSLNAFQNVKGTLSIDSANNIVITSLLKGGPYTSLSLLSTQHNTLFTDDEDRKLSTNLNAINDISIKAQADVYNFTAISNSADRSDLASASTNLIAGGNIEINVSNSRDGAYATWAIDAGGTSGNSEINIKSTAIDGEVNIKSSSLSAVGGGGYVSAINNMNLGGSANKQISVNVDTGDQGHILLSSGIEEDGRSVTGTANAYTIFTNIADVNIGHLSENNSGPSVTIEAYNHNDGGNLMGIWHNYMADQAKASGQINIWGSNVTLSTISDGKSNVYTLYDVSKSSTNLVASQNISLSASNNLGTIYGVYNSNSTVNLKTLSNAAEISVNAISKQGTVYGIYGSNSNTTIENTGTNGIISIGASSENSNAYGVRGSNSSNLSLNSDQIKITVGNDEIAQKTGYALIADGRSIVTLNSGKGIDISAQSSLVQPDFYGIFAYSSALVNLNSEGNISVSSLPKDINGQYYGLGTSIRAYGGAIVTLSTTSTNQIVGAIYSSDKNTEVKLNAQKNIVNSYSYIPDAGGLQDDKSVISALYAGGKGAQISLTGEQNYLSTFADSSVHTDLERVVWAYGGAGINIDGFTSITTDSYEKSLNSIDIAIAAGTAVNLTEDIVTAPVTDRAQVKINYANTTDSEGKAVLSSVTGDILSAYAGSVKIAPKSASDGLVVTGNLLAGNNGELTVDIGTNGVLTGRSDDYGDAGFITDSEHTTFFDPAFSSAIYKGGQVKLKMGDNARWNVTGQSWITDISVADGAKNVLIDLVNDNTNRNSTAHALTVYNLKGNATFNMSLDGNRDVSDMLYIRNANGEYIVNVVDAVTVDDMYKGGLNGLRFATVGAGSKAKFRAFTYDKGALNVEYEVATDSYDNNPENDIYNGTEMSHEKPGSTVVDGLFGYEEGAVATLALNDEASTKAANGTINETTNFKLVDRKDATPSDSGKTIIDHARANYANAVQLDTLNKRQGEMRFSQGHENGLWARIRHDDIGKRSSFRLDNTMVEVGVDSRYVKETGEFHTGVAFDYMNGDTDYHHISGEGDLDRYGVWFYTTWLGNEGDYTDFIIKCSLIDNEYKIYAPTTGEKITGDYDNNVISVSLEHGKKYSNEESWFIEPQAQLQYAYVTSAEYTNSQGTDVRLDGIHSLIGRVGLRAGKDVTRDNSFTFYARGDIMHEFMGKQDIKAKDATGTMRVRYENDDTWYSAGLGMSYQHNKDKYYFLEAEKVFGGSNTSSYIVSGGVRFLFD